MRRKHSCQWARKYFIYLTQKWPLQTFSDTITQLGSETGLGTRRLFCGLLWNTGNIIKSLASVPTPPLLSHNLTPNGNLICRFPSQSPICYQSRVSFCWFSPERQWSKTQIAPALPSVVIRMSVTREKRQRFDQNKHKLIHKKVKMVTVFWEPWLWDSCKWPWLLCLDSIFSSPSNFNSNQLHPIETNLIYSGKEQRCLIKIWTNSLLLLLSAVLQSSLGR